MARKTRLYLEKVSQNILIKGLSNQNVFQDQEDYEKCLEIINILVTKDLHIHSYCLLSNQINIYCTSMTQETLSKFIQKFGRLYVRYFNKKYERTGTLWDGRYKSSLVEDIVYSLDVMKYVEQLPLKFNILDLSNYKYSSYISNALGKYDSIITPHILYKNLDLNKEKRTLKYKNLLNKNLSLEKFNLINESLNKQLVTGSVGFCENLEKILGKKLTQKQRGRPKKTLKEDTMYKKLVVLDKVAHKDLKVASLKNLEFAKNLSFIPIVINETSKIGESFPIVFTSGDNPTLVSIVSLGGSNLALNNEYKWITNYIPINLRKYPFSIASVKENPEQKIILIDEESYLVNEKEGSLLFDETNEQTDLLKNAINFLKDVDSNTQLSNNISKIIYNSGILEDREITIGEGNEKKILVKGFKIVSKEKLNALGDDILADWVRKGIITFIDAHIKSLENIQKLFELASKQQQ